MHSSLLFSIFCFCITSVLSGAIAPVVSEDLLSLLAWQKVAPQFKSREHLQEVIRKMIASGEEVPPAYLIGAALAPQYGNDPLTLLLTLAQNRILFHSGNRGLENSIRTHQYFSACTQVGHGYAWGFRPTSMHDIRESIDLTAINRVLTKDPLTLKIDLSALKHENAWVSYTMVTAYALLQKWGSRAHEKVSELIENRNKLIKAPADKDLYKSASEMPLFIDSLLTAEEFQKVVVEFPVLSLDAHNTKPRARGNFVWEIYQHAFLRSITEWAQERISANRGIPHTTEYALRIVSKRTISEQMTRILDWMLRMIIAEKLGDFKLQNELQENLLGVFKGDIY